MKNGHTILILIKELIKMTKDSQPDNKYARLKKANFQTPITEEGHNHNRNNKKQSGNREQT